MENKKRILCSACLLGVRCRYDGASKLNEKVLALAQKEVLIPVCPEQLGGFATPRGPAQLQNCSGGDVLDKKGVIKNEKGLDVSSGFIHGAEQTLEIAKLCEVEKALMKQKSPSCGCGKIHDGSFTGNIREGDGITTALLKRNGIKVITEEYL